MKKLETESSYKLDDYEVMLIHYNSIKRELFKHTTRHFNIEKKDLKESGFWEICDLMEKTQKLPDSIIYNLRCIHQIHEEFILNDLKSVYQLDGTLGLLVQEASDYINPRNQTKSALFRILIKSVERRLKSFNK